MSCTKEQLEALPCVVRVFIHDHTKRHDPEHADSLGRHRINMMQDATFADVGLKVLHKFRQEKPEQGRLVEVDVIMDSQYCSCALDDRPETLNDGEFLHVFLTEPSSALAPEAPQNSSANTRTEPAQSLKGLATPNPPNPANGASSFQQQQPTQALGRVLRSRTKPKETPPAAGPPLPIDISSDSSDPISLSSKDTDCVIVGENPDSTQKPGPTSKPLSKTIHTSTNVSCDILFKAQEPG